jgi:protein SCO1
MRPKRSLRSLPIAVLLVVGALFLAVAPASAAPPGSPWGANYFPNVPLTTQDGQVVHFYDDLLKDKIVVVNFIYTHCQDACPLETARLAQVQQRLGERMGKDVFFYSITIDPTRDTPAVLKAYAEKFHVGRGWLFLTGQKADIALLQKKLGLFSEPNPADRDGHTANMVLGNESTGQWLRNTALDNPQYLAVMIGDWLNSWQTRKAIKSYTEVTQLTLDPGEHLFRTRCAACHTLGKGDTVGPDLRGVMARRDRAWLAHFIATPDQLLAEGDSLAIELFTKYRQVQMPNLRLGEADVAFLLSYLEAQDAARQGGDTREAVAHLPADGRETVHEPHHVETGGVK